MSWLVTAEYTGIGALRDIVKLVENALLATATYKIIDENGLKVRTEKTKRTREIFELFGVEDPESINGTHE